MRRHIVLCLLLSLSVLALRAQQRRIPCVRSGAGDTHALTRATRSVSKLSGKVRVPVILAAYPDCGFKYSDDETRANWEAMLSQHGYSEHGARGCLSDYFLAQSGGKFEIVFDVMGPVMLPQPMAYYGKNNSTVEGSDSQPGRMILDACQATGADFSPYDWDGDMVVDVVLVVYAGQGEHRGGSPDAIWPHMFTTGGMVGNLYLSAYACTSELRENQELDGYGTLCHEFSHCLGLPDLYTDRDEYSIFDEWDLMDGGNYSNYGFGVPNYSAFERHLCGWLDYQELSAPVAVSDMPALDDQPVAYVVYNDGYPDEYFVLENRQQQGWDYYIPGNGLLVTHVCDYSGSLAPNQGSRSQVSLVAADNRTYRESEAFFGASKYGADGRNKYMSLSAYPYITDSVCNDSLTNNSVPAAVLKNANIDGSLLLSKPVTDIRMDESGRISFDFMTKIPVAVTAPRLTPAVPADSQSGGPPSVVAYYDLHGRRLSVPADSQSGGPRTSGVYLIQYSDGTIRKSIR